MNGDAPSCAFTIFGITGDLAARKLLPALYQLQERGDLHPDTRLVGYGRSELDDDALRERVREALEEFGNGDGLDDESWGRFGARLSYVQGGYGEPEGFARLRGHLDALDLPDGGAARRVFYTATPPETYAPIAVALAEAGLDGGGEDGWTRLVIEKPFGTDLDSARELNRVVLAHFDESQIYRIDHYLAKETAQNLAVLRFANALFEPVWSNRSIDHVQITMAEPLGVEGRGSFYEGAGVIRDVFQNHLLQLVALVAMEPPARYDARSVRSEKVKVFRAMTCLEPDRAVLGQYAAGDGEPSYREEEGVAADSTQATFAAAGFEIRNWRWSGVPFFLRAGKRMAMKATEIVLQFKVPPHVPFDLDEPVEPDRLVLRVAPNEGIAFRFNGKDPGQGIDLERISMNFYYDQRFDRPNPDAYETLILDVMLGDATLFMRADEVEAQWEVVEPLLAAGGSVEPVLYPSGSMGPEEAFALLERNGRRWHAPDDGSPKEA